MSEHNLEVQEDTSIIEYAMIDESMAVNSVQAVRLIRIPVTIEGNSTKAMVDSGAQSSCVKLSFVEKLIANIDKTDSQILVGYGGKEFKTRGSVMLCMNIVGMILRYKFQVLENSNMKHDLILGMNFLRDEEVQLDVKNRIVKIGNRKKENGEFKLDDKDEVFESRHDKIPVYALTNVTINKGSNSLIPLDMKHFSNTDFYFEGENTKGLTYHCGVICCSNHEVIV